VNSPIARFAFHLTAGRQWGTIPPRIHANTNTKGWQLAIANCQALTRKKEETQ